MSAVPGLFIDWDGDGFATGAYDDCTDLVISANYSRGGTPEITGAAQIGQATFVLQNPDGRFDPDYAAGPLYGKLRDGVPVWWGANADGTINDKGATVYGRFAGRTTEIAPLPVAGAGDSTPTVQIVCEDALGWYGRTPVVLSDDCSPVPPPSGFHQVVLTANSNEGTGIVSVAGTSVRAVFGGASNANTYKTSGIAQDTDGFAVQIPDAAAANQNPLPFVSCQQIVVPAGCHGTYAFSWGEFPYPAGVPLWYDAGSLAGHPVPFPGTASQSVYIDAVVGGDATLTAELKVNGTTVATDTQTRSGGLRLEIMGTTLSGSVHLSDGDVVELWLGFTAIAGGYAVNTLGAAPFAGQQGIFALTWTGP